VNWPALPKKITKIGRNKFSLFWKEMHKSLCKQKEKKLKTQVGPAGFSRNLKTRGATFQRVSNLSFPYKNQEPPVVGGEFIFSGRKSIQNMIGG
jgi:hypothetical protein